MTNPLFVKESMLNVDELHCAIKAKFLEFGSSDWTRTSSVSPVITAFVKYSHIFTNIFTIIIVFLW
ncbi:hypothetical protein ESCOMM109M1_21355 [Escherichia coli]